jgi:hypothetical protein
MTATRGNPGFAGRPVGGLQQVRRAVNQPVRGDVMTDAGGASSILRAGAYTLLTPPERRYGAEVDGSVGPTRRDSAFG